MPPLGATATLPRRPRLCIGSPAPCSGENPTAAESQAASGRNGERLGGTNFGPELLEDAVAGVPNIEPLAGAAVLGPPKRLPLPSVVAPFEVLLVENAGGALKKELELLLAAEEGPLNSPPLAGAPNIPPLLA